MYLFTTFMTSPKKDSLFFSKAICEHYVALVKTHFSDLYFRLVKECKTNSRDKFNLYLAKSSLLLFVVFHAFGDIDQVGEAAFAAVLPVMMVGHEDTRTTDLLGTLPPQASDPYSIAIKTICCMHIFTTFMTSPKKDSLFFSKALCEHHV